MYVYTLSYFSLVPRLGVPVFRGAYTYRHEFPYYPERSAETDATATAVTPAGSPGS